MDHRSLADDFARADRARRGAWRDDPETRNAAAVLASFARVDRQRREDNRSATRARMRRAGRTASRRTAIAALVLLVAYALLCLPLAWYQTSLVYWADATPIDEAHLPAGTTLRHYVSHDPDVEFAAYVHQGGPMQPTLVYLHGRGETFGMIQANTSDYALRGWTVVAPEYPGFGGLKGAPTERTIGTLMGVVHDDLVARGTDHRRIAIHGNSLGAGPALQLAQFPHGFLLLTAPVASLRDLVHRYAPFQPTFLLRDAWDNEARARTRFPAPAQVVHAVDDQVVPVEQGRRLAKAAHAAYREEAEGGHAIAWRGEALEFTGRATFRYGGDTTHDDNG